MTNSNFPFQIFKEFSHAFFNPLFQRKYHIASTFIIQASVCITWQPRRSIQHLVKITAFGTRKMGGNIWVSGIDLHPLCEWHKSSPVHTGPPYTHNTFTYIHDFGSGHTNTIGECLPKAVMFQATQGFPENSLPGNLSTNFLPAFFCGCPKVTPTPLDQIWQKVPCLKAGDFGKRKGGPQVELALLFDVVLY